MNDIGLIDDILRLIRGNLHNFDLFRDGVESFFRKHPRLTCPPPIIHSVKGRIKEESHIRDKLIRKISSGECVNTENCYEKITDIAGVRVLHLYQEQFTAIHECINEQLTRKDWVLFEPPVAYTWDPESMEFFRNFELQVEVKESFYTSIHYVVKPRPDSELTCEIQVRTLFEEIWGEIDHTINYPTPTNKLACREMLRVLARLVGAGSRLADSIFRTHKEQI
ncbi:MAG: RelA/SpoT domain-containing protein [Desulfobaccales bacterium]